MSSQRPSPDNTALSSKDRFLHLKSIDVTFPGDRRNATFEVKLKIESLKHKSPKLQATKTLHWECEVYIEANATALLVIRNPHIIWPSSNVLANIPLDFQSIKFADDMSIKLTDEIYGITGKIILGDAKSSTEVTRLLANEAKMALATKVNTLEMLDRILGVLQPVLDTVENAAQLYPPLQVAVSVVSSALKRLQEIPDCHQGLTSIMDDVASILPSVEQALEHAHDVQLRKLINDYFDIIRGVSENIKKDHSPSDPTFFLRSLFKSKKDDVEELKDRMVTLKSNIDLAVNIQNQKEILEMRKHQLLEAEKNIQKEDEEILNGLKPPAFSSYDPERCCLQGTRVSTIEEIVKWSQSRDTTSRLFWLHGVAGCGKSSVATSVARALHEPENQHIPSYSFFCKRDDPERRSAIRVVHAITFYLSRTSEDYRSAVIQKLKNDPTLLDNGPHKQFKALLVDCVNEMSGLAPPHSIIIILDALDECDDNEMLSKFLIQSVKLASWFKVIVTSRPLPSIQRNLESSGVLLSPYDLFATPAEADILHYTKHQFADDGDLALLRRYVTSADIEKLALKALGLFIWIKVVCSYIGQRKPGRLDRLTEIISSPNASGSERQLDELYLQVLNHAAGSVETRALKADIRIVVGIVLAASRNRPLPSEALFAFRPSEKERWLLEEWEDMLQDMRSVLITDSRTAAIRVCHKSFLDFLGSQERSGEFWTEPSELEQLMAKKCLSVMLAPSGLKFNICELKTSYLSNRDVKDLIVDQHIPRELQYSCLYWLNHLSTYEAESASQESIRQMLRELLCHAKSLYWLEVLSLLYELREAIVILDGFMNLLKRLNIKDELYTFANDLYRFVKAFHEPMAMSTSHIYISALAWAPSESVIAKSIGRLFNSRACLLDGHNEFWSNNVQIMLVNSVVNCVAYSPDGRFIVSGSDDGIVRIWDAETGVPVGETLRGHNGAVLSVNFSADGRRILSGYSDGTIRIWDAETSVPVGEPLRGHGGEVWFVNCSPDGRRIVSGFADGTIQTWDSETVAPVGKPHRGHDDWVRSVNYSADGHRIVSGSSDGTIRMWDAETGASIREPLRGHVDGVRSVNYSPNGRRIVSGSYDGTIRIWDARTGSPIREPLRGHDGGVRSVNYSPDGRHIVSGSYDSTIRMWDAETGAPLGGPIRGHDGGVRSVNYSPDGRRIVSGSYDGTIRTWDAETVAPVGKPHRGHDGGIRSINYSADGRRIVSGSADGTIRIWDAGTGVPVGEPLRGHAGGVLSVNYSADGRRIVSGSEDGTIRIWDAETGASVGEALRVHDDWVSSVNYSPDGLRIVSGSSDGTIRIWDAGTGVPVGGPLRGHNRAVWSVKYSADGRRIVSGFSDGTIWTWDAKTGVPVGEPLRGYGGEVWSMSYSPDGRRIVSGFSDNTIRIRDAGTGAPVGEPLRGHSGVVRSVNYSPDGRRIVSGSEDHTGRVWNAEADALIVSSLRHREYAVCPVSASDNQMGSTLGEERYTSYDVSSWKEGEWRYSVDDGYFVSRKPGAPAKEVDPVLRSRSPQRVPPDGWIRTTNDGLLLWIPPEHRVGVCDMSLFCLPPNARGHAVGIDWKKLCYGTEWPSVRVGD